MRRPLLAALMAVLLVSACSTKLNPFNWFRKSAPAETTALVLPGPEQDARPLVAQVLTMTVEPMNGGAVVRATGLPPTQGWWEAELVALPLGEDGNQIFDFRMLPPIAQADVSTQRSREVTAAYQLSAFKLANIRTITVQGAANALSSSR